MEDKNFWKGLVEGTLSEEVEEKINPHKVMVDTMYNMYQAFIQAGFSPDQAFWFVSNSWIFSMQQGQRK